MLSYSRHDTLGGCYVVLGVFLHYSMSGYVDFALNGVREKIEENGQTGFLAVPLQTAKNRTLRATM